MLLVSVIIPTYNEEGYISQCLDSVLLQDYPHAFIEVFVVDGMSNDNTRLIVKEYSEKYPFIHLLDNHQKIVPYAMNIGISKANGEYIIRLDAHADYPSDYFSKLIRNAKELNADNVGGVCITDVKQKNKVSLAIREVLSNRFGVGNSVFRIGTDVIQETDTVVFGCFNKNVFSKYGLYDLRLERNQDIELNKRIKRNGGKLFTIPSIQCIYYARTTYRGLILNNFKNGLWNILTIFYTKTFSSLSIRHFIPMFFAIALVFPILLFFFYPPVAIISISTFVIYSFVFLSISTYVSWRKKLNLFTLWLAFFLLHISYGLGAIIGLLKLPFIKNVR